MKDIAYFKKLAHQLMFDLSDDEVKDIMNEFETLTEQLKLLEKIDTANVEEMVYPFEDETSFLREDVVSNVISQQDALANVKNSTEGHFVVPKVVK
ncbi:MAG: Asp-tRNA(Asn)/Glu-tRNA(Gln) amidotransferase subunit GatC [Erysipelotrichaceae bacterium]|nr:Asp-tRNA(Asn)/Glu-tRNA(Gln) amidotransferase subunit GatC [Erysipelotrichaceae bacterium]